MGTGASTSIQDSPSSFVNAVSEPALTNSHIRHSSAIEDYHRDMSKKQTEGSTVVRTNKVAPVVIKSCKEEFQHHTDFKEPIVYGRVHEDMPEHALILNRYFLVKDITPDLDKLGTLGKYNIPNLRRCRGTFPVYGMGQPTKDGLTSFVNKLRIDGHEDILLLNIREEPVVFLKDGFDYIPYSPRHPDCMEECVVNHDLHVDAVTELEVRIRKECIDLASFRDDNHFYFYNDVEKLKDEPHMYRMAYEDDMSITDEVYWRLEFNNSGIRYLRLALPSQGAPMEQDIDAFVDMFRYIPSYFDRESKEVPAVVFTSHSGNKRATFGMVMGSLMIAHKRGFPSEARKTPFQINEKSPNFERGEFYAIQRLVKYLRQGLQRKLEVDVLIDQSSELHNLRSAAAGSKAALENVADQALTQTLAVKQLLLDQCLSHLERYFYLICFNAYLHEQYSCLFAEPFSLWMGRQPELYSILSHMNVAERNTTAELLINKKRYLVADDFCGLDVLSSQMEVKTSNFRRVPGTSVYGMAQPSREGLSKVVDYLLNTKQGHPIVVWFNLREDLVIECNGATYSMREESNLPEPIIMSGIKASDIEEKETQLRNAIKERKSFEVYEEITENRNMMEFNSVLTCTDMYEQQKMKSSQRLQYHRIPMNDDSAPHTQFFESVQHVMDGLSDIYGDEDGPALVFQCRTGRGRTTTAMAIAGLILFHKKGFPYGTKPGEEERVSLQNATYTQGNFKIVQELVRRIPDGQQVKREVDFVLNQCSETMTPMHYHMREMIFVTYNKIKKAKTEEERVRLRKQSLDYLERYMYLILFNTYLHCERRNRFATKFSTWMQEVAYKAGVCDVLDNLAFFDFEAEPDTMKTRRKRWGYRACNLPLRGSII